MLKKIVVNLFLIGVLSLFVLPQNIFAVNLKDSGNFLNQIAGSEGAGLDTNADVSDIIGTVIKAVLGFVGLIFLVLTVYAGILWMTANGEEAKVEKSKEIIKAALIGIFITASAYAITAFVTNRFEG